MQLWGNSRPCAVQTSAFSKGTDLTITKIHLFSDSSNQRASNSVQVNSSPTTGLQKVFRGWPYQLSEGDTHLSSHSWSLVSFRVSSVWKRQLIFSILQIPLTRRQFWKRLHSLSLSFFFMLRSLKFCRLPSHGSCALPHNSPLLAGASQYLSTVFGWA